MKIKTLNYDFTHKYRYKSDYEHSYPQSENKSVGLCDNNRGYNVAFSGSQEKSVAAANTFMGKILKSGWFNGLAKFSGAHNIASSALISLFLAGLLRPGATLALPGKKDKEDKVYAAGHSFSSAVVGFIFSTIVTSPLDSGSKFMINDGQKMSKADYDKLSKEEINKILEEKFGDIKAKEIISKGAERETLSRKFEKGISIITSKTDKINELKRILKNTTDVSKRTKLNEQIRDLEKHIKGIDTTMHNVVDWGIAIPRAMLTIALIPPILKYVFHLEKKKPKVVEPQVQPAVQYPQPVAARVSFNDFVGGRR